MKSPDAGKPAARSRAAAGCAGRASAWLARARPASRPSPPARGSPASILRSAWYCGLSGVSSASDAPTRFSSSAASSRPAGSNFSGLDLPLRVGVREVGEAIGKVRRVLHVQVGEPDVELAGFVRLEALLRQEALATLSGGAARAAPRCRAVGRALRLPRALQRGDQLGDLRKRRRALDPCRRVLRRS